MITAAEVRAASRQFCKAVDGLGPIPAEVRDASRAFCQAVDGLTYETKGNQIVITVLELGGAE